MNKWDAFSAGVIAMYCLWILMACVSGEYKIGNVSLTSGYRSWFLGALSIAVIGWEMWYMTKGK
ncbi:hypothetical protein [Furfurilactobacillus entadae]|uniref:hypothetical protein n=1 Tax=Furfurilactobacillus entadae TaxID=2922307 RepID=UPI0035EADEB4